ncbi:MAG: TatD family hydrolase [Sphaerochaetaceae bacterium]
MFDAHRHFGSNLKENALYATSVKTEWHSLLTLQEPAIGGIGALANKPLPTIEEVEQTLRNYPTLQIAEVGLDRRFSEIEEQQTFLKDILSLAYTLSRSVSLHCVREDGRMLSTLKALYPHLPILLWHGFTGSMETGKEAAKLGVILSYGISLYQSKLARERAKLISVPYALETDFETGDNYHGILEEHVRTFSTLSGCSKENLIRNNDEIRAILTYHTSTR